MRGDVSVGWALLLCVVTLGACAQRQALGPQREAINPSTGAPSPLYSVAVRSGNLTFLSGVLRRSASGDIPEATRNALDSIRERVEGSGGTMAEIVQCTVFLTDIDHYQEMNEAYLEYFPSDPPRPNGDRRGGGSGLRSDGDRVHLGEPVRMRSEPSVILIREWEEQLSGSGCCGQVEGHFLVKDGQPAFGERRACMDAMGPIYRTLKNRFGDAIELQVVDPRNMLTVIFLLLRDFWAFKVGLGEALTTIGRLPVQAVLINGRLVARGEWPDSLKLIEILEDAMSEAALHPV